MISEGDVQIGFNAPTSGLLIAADSLTRIITEGEALGFDYVTISDHIMVPRNLESRYPYTDTGEFPAGTQAAWLEQLATTAYVAALIAVFEEVRRVLRDDGTCWVNLGDSYAMNGIPGLRASGDHPRDCECSYCTKPNTPRRAPARRPP